MSNPASLNPQQREAVETIHGPVLILAGAGTGKTRVITFRIAHLIAKGVAAGNILAVTFTNKAAREMQERVGTLLPRKPRKDLSKEEKAALRPTICTFHSLCVRILREHIEKLGYKRNFIIYDEAEQLSAIKRILSTISMRGGQIEPGMILSALSRIKNAGRNSRVVNDNNADAVALATHIQPRYQSALRACNAVDFDDLILLTLRLFREHPEALAACQDRYRYVMVDEYQDTNAAQFELVQALTAKHRNLCVVGDDDQSIYGWRGAEISNLLDMERHFPEVKVIKLEQNYRSTNRILEAANAVIQQNLQRRPKRLWSDKGDGALIALECFDDEEKEALGAVEKIEVLRAQRLPLSDMAVLFRTNAQSRPLETAFRQKKVPYRIVGGQSFFDRREIRDFLGYVKMFINPHDDISLLRIANVPARGLSDATMERLVEMSRERKCSVYSAMKNPAVTTTFAAQARESIERFTHFIDETRSGLGREGDPGAHGLQQWASAFLAQTGYIEDLRRSEKNPDTAQSRVENVRDLIATMDGEDLRMGLHERLEAFLEELTLDNEREAGEEEAGNAVTLITMHSCKGLEYPVVFIVGLEENLLPHARSEVEHTLDEERRLFYVALTRAMRTLKLSFCKQRKKYGKPVFCQPSRFLKELPSHLVENENETARRPVAPEAGKGLFSAMRQAIG